MEDGNATGYQLPSELVSLREQVRRIIHDEVIPVYRKTKAFQIFARELLPSGAISRYVVLVVPGASGDGSLMLPPSFTLFFMSCNARVMFFCA